MSTTLTVSADARGRRRIVEFPAPDAERKADESGRGKSPRYAVIKVRNLRLRTFIGFNPDERVKQQDVVINIEIRYAINRRVLNDDVTDALDYKAITKSVIKRVEQGRYLLLEKLTAEVLDICSDHPDIIQASVTIDKPHALRFADSVSLSLEYNADGDSQPGESK